MADDTKYTEIKAGENNDPNVVEGKKRFIFNSTGNIMVSTTDETSAGMDDGTRSVFNEVSVFFAAMTKAITTTPKPGNTGNCYSIYDYDALSRVIGGSGCFVHCMEEDIKYSSSSVGMTFSQELFTALLGLPTGAGALSFAQAMVSSMGKEGLKIDAEKQSSSGKVGNIVFVCEYLFGMPLVTAVVINVSTEEVKKVMSVSPCFKTESSSVTMAMHKDVYMFVTPSFIKRYSGDLDSIMTTSDYSSFVSYLRSLITRNLYVDGLFVNDGAKTRVTNGVLTVDTEYMIAGENFGDAQGTLKIGDTAVAPNTWNNEEVLFTPKNAVTEVSDLVLTTAEGKSVKVGAVTVNDK